MKKYFLLLFLVASFNRIAAMDEQPSASRVDFYCKAMAIVPAWLIGSDYTSEQQDYVQTQVQNLHSRLDEELKNPCSLFVEWKQAGLTQVQILQRFALETAQSMRSSNQMPHIPISFRFPSLYPERDQLKLIKSK
jgi:hypothetical protein